MDVLTPMHRLESSEVAASVAFSIVTEGSEGQVKVRRGEDWLRSHHNATTQTKGGPRHHTVDDLVLAARWLHRRRPGQPSHLGSRPRKRIPTALTFQP